VIPKKKRKRESQDDEDGEEVVNASEHDMQMFKEMVRSAVEAPLILKRGGSMQILVYFVSFQLGKASSAFQRQLGINFLKEVSETDVEKTYGVVQVLRADGNVNYI
jgi:hypothetical protein